MPEITISNECSEWALALDPKYKYIFIKGGRMSGKSHEIASYLTERSITELNLKVVCLREIQKSIKHSSKQIIEQKIKDGGLAQYYKSVDSEIRKLHPKDDGLFLFQGMNDLTADNVKSLEGFKVSWFEEAQNISRKSLKTLKPTIMRIDGAQMIFTWNPKFPDDPIEEFCNEMRGEDDVLVIHVNYDENAFLGEGIINEIERDKRKFPDDFEHIYLGQYDTSFHGHYYAKLLDEAAADGRISKVQRKTGVDIITAWDLGRADSTCIWVAQVIGKEVRIIDYIGESFKDLDYFADWIKQNNYNGLIGLPHDAAHKRLGMKGSIEDQLKQMGLTNTRVLPAYSVDAGRRLAKTLIKEAWFDKEKTKDGITALRHERAEKDEKTGKWKEIHEQDGAAAFRYLAHYLDKKAPAQRSVSFRIEPQGSYMGL